MSIKNAKGLDNNLLRYLTLFLIIVSTHLSAQTHNEKVTIFSAFQPSLREATKISINPNAQSAVLKTGELNFSNIDRVIDVKSEPPLIAFTQVKTDEKTEKFRNYLKAALGTNLSPFFFFQHHSAFSKNMEFDLGIRHQSSWVDVKDYAPSSWMKNDFSIGTHNVLGEHLWHNDLVYSFDNFHYYGFKPEDYSAISIEKDLLKQHYQRIGFKSTIQSNYKDNNLLHHEVSLAYHNFSDKHKRYEHAIKVDGTLKKYYEWFRFDSKQMAAIDLQANFFSRGDSMIENRSFFVKARPYLQISGSFYEVKAGFLLTLASDSSSQFFAHPLLSGKLFLFEDKVEMYAQFEGENTYHSLNDITLENPFIRPGEASWWTNTKQSFTTGIKTSVIPKLDLNLGLTYAKVENGGFYIADSSTQFKNLLTVEHDNFQQVRFFAEASYHHTDQLQSILNLTFDTYETEKIKKAWHLPAFQGKWELHYRLNDQWSFETGLLLLGERFAPGNYTTLFEPIRLKPVTDLNLDVNYSFSKQFAVFLQLNNALNNRYERFYNYPVQGFQLFAGMSLRF
jgi:hypothetical protein